MLGQSIAPRRVKHNEKIAVFDSKALEYAFGVFHVALSAVTFCVVSLFVHLATVVLGVKLLNIVLVRSFLSVVYGAVGCWYLNLPGWPRMTSFGDLLLVARGFMDVFASGTWYYACGHMPLGLATVIFFTNPFYTVFISYWWLKEPCRCNDILSAILAFLGMLIACSEELSSNASSGITVSKAVIGTAVLAAVLQSFTYCIIRRLSLLESSSAPSGVSPVHFFHMATSYGLAGLAVSALLYATDYGVLEIGSAEGHRILAIPDLTTIGSITVVIACTAIAAQTFLNIGTKSVEAGQVSVIRTLDIPMALAFQQLIGRILPDSKEVSNSEALGGALVILAAVLIVNGKQVDDDDDERIALRDVEESVPATSESPEMTGTHKHQMGMPEFALRYGGVAVALRNTSRL